jgi:fermentation-respiration switch protein FrsA (DUF1100 family)
VTLVLLCVFAYGAAVAHLISQETELIFRNGAARADRRPSVPYQQVDIPRADGARQFGWVIRANEADVWVLFLHGNASTIASRMNVAHVERLHALGVNVFAPEYRGYNGLPGVPTEASVVADARAGYDYLRNQLKVSADRIAIFGWSLGAAVAVDLASQVDSRTVILEGAPASIVDIGQQRYPMFPIRWIIRNPFHAIQHIADVRAPLLFLHSPEDTVVPFAEGRRLFEAATAPKKFVQIKGGHVESSEVDRDVFYAAVREALNLPSSVLPAAASR